MDELAAKRAVQLAPFFKIVARTDETGAHEWLITCRKCEQLGRSDHTWSAPREVNKATGRLEQDIDLGVFNNLMQHTRLSTRKHRET
jgi:hypothetical protein